jgi:general secretion pathway protein M
MNLPIGIRGRLLAVLLLLLAVAAIVAALAVPAYLLYNRYSTERSAVEERIDRYNRLSSQRIEHQKALDMLKSLESARFFLKNSAPNLGGAELTDMVRPLLESNTARLTSIQPVTVKDDGGYRAYSLNVGFNATPAALQKTLFALETAIPYLFIENITMRATVPRGYKPPPNQEPEVSVQLEVQAYGPKSINKGAVPAAAGGANSPLVKG